MSKAPELKKAFSEIVKERRKALGCSQEEFADRIGVHRTFMGGIERGRHVVSIGTAFSVAEGLGISIGQLLDETVARMKSQATIQD